MKQTLISNELVKDVLTEKLRELKLVDKDEIITSFAEDFQAYHTIKFKKEGESFFDTMPSECEPE